MKLHKWKKLLKYLLSKEHPKKTSPIKRITPRKVTTPVKASTPMKRKTPRLKCRVGVGFASQKAKARHERFQCKFNTTDSPVPSPDFTDNTVCRICDVVFTERRSRGRHEREIHNSSMSGTSLLGSRNSDTSERDVSPASSSG